MNSFGYHMEPNDIVIRRVRNGWVVFKARTLEDDHEDLLVSVHEDDQDPADVVFKRTHPPGSRSFNNLLWDNWDWLFRSKRRGGLTTNVYSHGYENEE